MTQIFDPKRLWCGACLTLAAGLVTALAASGPMHADSMPAAGVSSFSRALFEQAACCEREGEFELARATYEEICRLDSADGQAWHRLGVVSMRLGQMDRALECFQTALELMCEDAELLNDYGFALFVRNDLASAEELLRRSLELVPQNRRAINNLAIVVGAQGRDAECRALFEQVATGAALEKNLAFVRKLRQMRPVARRSDTGATAPIAPRDPSDEPVEAPVPERFTTIPTRLSAVLAAPVARLADADPLVRRAALAELAALTGEAAAAAPAIEPLLADSDPGVRAEAARTLWLIGAGSDAAVPALVELLACEDPAIRVLAAFTLGNLGDSAARALPVLARMMADRSGAERVHAAEAVLRIARHDRDAIAVLTAAAHDPDGEVRLVAVYALGMVALQNDSHERQALGALTSVAAQDAEPRIREAAALNLDICRTASGGTLRTAGSLDP